jgi:gluconolactonase
VLYVNDTRLGEIRAYDMRPDGSCGPKRLFHKLAGSEPGIADGMKVDREGNVYCTGPGGVHVIGPDGGLLGRIRIPITAPTWPGARPTGARSTSRLTARCSALA